MDQRLARGGVELLMSEPVRRVDPKMIALLEPRLAVGAIVLMRWIAAPVSRWIERLTDDQALNDGIVDKDVMHLARVVLPAARVHADLVRANERRLGRTVWRRERGNQDRFQPRRRGHRELDARR